MLSHNEVCLSLVCPGARSIGSVAMHRTSRSHHTEELIIAWKLKELMSLALVLIDR